MTGWTKKGNYWYAPKKNSQGKRLRMKTKPSWQKDKIKTQKDVYTAIDERNPVSVIVQETNFALTTTPTTQHSLSDIEFSNSNDRPDSRKSLKIRAGHVKCRAYLEVGDRTNLCRVMVVRNRNAQQPGTAFNPATMFEMNNGVGTQPNNMYAEPNLRQVDVKYDRVFNLQDTSEASPAVRPKNIYFEFSVPFHETWQYLTTANNTSEWTRNKKDYFIVAFSDSSILPNPSLKLSSYTWFKNIGNTA